MKLPTLVALLLFVAACSPARAAAGEGRRLLAESAYVCIRPLDIPGVPDQYETMAAVHCYVQSGSSKTPSWSSAFDPSGVHLEVKTGHPKRICKLLSGATVERLKTAQWSQIRTGLWDAADYDFDDHNCCHYVDAIIRAAGSRKGVTAYFPGYDFPPNLPW